MNRWHVYNTLKYVWIDNQGKRSLTVRQLLRMFPNIDDNELQEGIVEFRLMSSRCYKEYGFDTELGCVSEST